jgi:hypothetical protein
MGPPVPADLPEVAPVRPAAVSAGPAAATPHQPVAISPPQARSPSAAAARDQVPRPSFSDAFGDLKLAQVDITPARGAVDLRRITPARAVPKPPPPPPPPSHPSRIWVELGVGRDTDRMAFDWRRMVKGDPELFRGKKPFVSGWARTNRLLVGPFETEKAANSFTDKLHKADETSAFVWTSPAGQVVDPLGND